MTYKIALNFEDGVTRFIDCKPSETVADAAYRQSINVPIDCRDGACGACKCSCESGSFRLGDHIDDALSQAEAEAGYVLTCQMYPQGDCVVRVPASSEVCKTKPAAFNATIAEVRQLSDSTISLTLSGDALKKLAFLPGQYANLTVPGTTQHRAYSFSSLPVDGRVSFLIRNVPGGLMSSYLREQAKAGETIALAGPYEPDVTVLHARTTDARITVTLGGVLPGGTGLAPFLAMLDKLLAEGGGSEPIHLIYGVNTDTDLVELDKLEAFAQALAHFTYALVVVAEDSAQPKKGYVTQHIAPAQLNDGDIDIYLCGPPPMVEAVSRHLHDSKVQAASFHYEKFAASV